MAFNFISPAGQPAEEIADPLLHQSFGPQAQVSGSLLPRPAPNRLIGVEVRAVARQAHQLYAQARRCQALSHRLAAVGRRVVPDHIQRPGVSFPQLHQAVASGRRPRSRSCCCPPVPSTPPPQYPGIPPNSSWPSRRAAGWSSPPTPVHPSAPTCPEARHPPGNEPRRQRKSWPRTVALPPSGQRTPPRRTPASFRRP